MDQFDWQARLQEAYRRFPEAQRKPVIGISGNYGEQQCKIAETYYKSIIKAGGTPLVIPPSADIHVIINTLEHIDGLMLTGGADINPLYAGEEPSPRIHSINSERDLPELLLTRLAYDRQIPMLGICRGIQTIAMALGGHVCQDISAKESVRHAQDADRSTATHTIDIDRGSTLYSLFGCETMAVNSFHHQAVDDPGRRFRITARSKDGIVEAIESREFKSILGVQWHPECMDEGQPLFRWLVRQASHFRDAHALHDHIVTLDTHCDTPMYFPQGINFCHRDGKILTDLHKMTAGRLDSTIMAAYIPQPKESETFADKVAFDVNGPAEYADLIFDKIEEIAHNHSEHIAIARTPDDLMRNKRCGRKSIMLAIENALALEGQLERLQHFADRGIIYMTLCHNGDNDVCDSARGGEIHGGVSDFGEGVIREMNRLGILVDMSHASEKSFYDALEISSCPIVCSHSSARALCDHPRNLTDDQMRALAQKGGVAQTTLYPGFLKAAGEATVLDAIAHLEHAIKVMGIDHVGIGTDFDGDGGVRGMGDASEVINFTRLLLARRYSDEDIQKIWGGNFIRLISQNQ